MQPQEIKLLPFEFARVNRVMVDSDKEQLLIAPGAPTWAIAEVSRTAGKLPVCSLEDVDFDALLSEIYSGRTGTSEAVMEDIKDFVDMESAAADLEEVSDLLDAENDDAPIVRLLNAILTESLKENASDIHIEPYEKQALVRFRLDGVLRTVLSPSVQIAPLLISRIKVMSKLDIAEKRLPQDGRMTVLLGVAA